MNKEYYRIEPEYYDGYYPTRYLICKVYVVIKETPKGAWIKKISWRDNPMSRKHFILTSSTKKFAYPTKEDAVNSFIKRKERQIKILSSQLADAENQLELIHDPSNIIYLTQGERE